MLQIWSNNLVIDHGILQMQVALIINTCGILKIIIRSIYRKVHIYSLIRKTYVTHIYDISTSKYVCAGVH